MGSQNLTVWKSGIPYASLHHRCRNYFSIYFDISFFLFCLNYFWSGDRFSNFSKNKRNNFMALRLEKLKLDKAGGSVSFVDCLILSLNNCPFRLERESCLPIPYPLPFQITYKDWDSPSSLQLEIYYRQNYSVQLVEYAPSKW